jgi:hypothetical protein
MAATSASEAAAAATTDSASEATAAGAAVVTPLVAVTTLAGMRAAAETPPVIVKIVNPMVPTSIPREALQGDYTSPAEAMAAAYRARAAAAEARAAEEAAKPPATNSEVLEWLLDHNFVHAMDDCKERKCHRVANALLVAQHLSARVLREQLDQLYARRADGAPPDKETYEMVLEMMKHNEWLLGAYGEKRAFDVRAVRTRLMYCVMPDRIRARIEVILPPKSEDPKPVSVHVRPSADAADESSEDEGGEEKD